MMKKRLTALIMASILVFGLGVNAALADGDTAKPVAQGELNTAVAAVDAEAATEGEEEAEAPAEPDAEGTLSFANLESRIRENNYNVLALERKIANIDATNLDSVRQDLIDGLNQIADAQWGMITSSSAASAALSGNPGLAMMGSASAASMQSTYDDLRQQLDNIKSGKTARDLENMRRQLTAGEDQLIMGMESAYIQLKAFEEQDAALTRGIAALDRGAQTAQISYEHGLVSQLTLDQLAAQRVQLVSKQSTLRMGIEVGKLNLKAMVGEDLGASLTLTALPSVTAKQLDAMDLEGDLARAQETSVDLFNANATLADARQEYQDSNSGNTARRTWEAAQFTYEAAQQDFELSFRTLYAQVKDYAQKVDAAKSALALEEKNYAVSALKCQQGTISQNALADAADTLASAKDTVSGAERDLLSAYRNYYWAVEHGILN